jgi:hypothetical protein
LTKANYNKKGGNYKAVRRKVNKTRKIDDKKDPPDETI